MRDDIWELMQLMDGELMGTSFITALEREEMEREEMERWEELEHVTEPVAVFSKARKLPEDEDDSSDTGENRSRGNGTSRRSRKAGRNKQVSERRGDRTRAERKRELMHDRITGAKPRVSQMLGTSSRLRARVTQRQWEKQKAGSEGHDCLGIPHCASRSVEEKSARE
jgi:hypothetical protein